MILQTVSIKHNHTKTKYSNSSYCCVSDGSKVAGSTTIDVLLRSPFTISINENTFAVNPPEQGELMSAHSGKLQGGVNNSVVFFPLIVKVFSFFISIGQMSHKAGVKQLCV